VVDTSGSLGCYSEKQVVLRNESECPLTIDDISAAGLDYEVTAPTQFPITLNGGEETLEATIRFTPQADAAVLTPSEVTGLLTVDSVDPVASQTANLCGESTTQSGMRILVTDVSSGAPEAVGEVDSLVVRTKGKHRPAPINLQFTNHPVSNATVCGNSFDYHVNLETLPAAGTTGANSRSSYQAKAMEGNLQAEESFTLDQCEFREFQLQLQSSDSQACPLSPKGASCNDASECCSGKCKGPSGGKTCK